MRFGEIITVHTMALVMCAFVGVFGGFWWYTYRFPLMRLEPAIVLAPERTETVIRKQSRIGAKVKGVTVVVFRKPGHCVAILKAETLIYPVNEGGTIYMTKPYIRRFTADGQLVTEVWSDEGEADVAENTESMDLSHVRLKGNVKMRRYAIETAQK